MRRDGAVHKKLALKQEPLQKLHTDRHLIWSFISRFYTEYWLLFQFSSEVFVKGFVLRRRGAMAFMVKHMIGGQLKDLTGGLGEEKAEGEKSEATGKGMTQEEFEEYQQQLAEEK